MSAGAPRGFIQLRPRSTTALIASRSDAPASGAISESGETLAGGAGEDSPRRVSAWHSDRGERLWPTVLTWVLLSAAIAALWALLLLGDSLPVSG